MRLVVVGSRKLTALPDQLITWLASHGTDVVLRRPRMGKPGRFERLVARACEAMWIPYSWREPGPGGRQATFVRDIEMVGGADAVLAFFADEEMSGGTEHVVEKAFDQRVPVYSYGIRDGQLVLLGAHDPDELCGWFTI